MIHSGLQKEGRSEVVYSFALKFAGVYFVLQTLPFPLSSIHYFSALSRTYYHVFNALVLWTGHHIFHLYSLAVTPYNGSGDKLFNYISLFVVVVLALLLTLAWQVVIRNQEKDRRIVSWMMIYIQFYFSLTMIRYGLEKVIQTQFPFPYNSLAETYGESSPMRLMWSFMGYSHAYNMITGIAEIIGGLLILFRKTVLMGACISIVILCNVVVLNFCYDVPVKLFSLTFFLMAVYVAAPDTKRFITFFLTNKAVPAKPIESLVSGKKATQLLVAGKCLLAVGILYFTVQLVWLKYSTWGNGAFAKTPLFGIYHVESFVKNTDTLSSLPSERLQWKELSLIYKNKATIRLVNDSIYTCRFVTDTIHQTMETGEKKNEYGAGFFSYTKQSDSDLWLTGKWQGDSLSIRLRKQDMNQYLLLNREFHWINEYPYNR